jgi:DNA-binding MurR/RpiR family transcriptional regulator
MTYNYFGSSGTVAQYTSYDVTTFNMTGNSSSDYHQGSNFVLTIYNINKDTT